MTRGRLGSTSHAVEESALTIGFVRVGRDEQVVVVWFLYPVVTGYKDAAERGKEEKESLVLAGVALENPWSASQSKR